VVGDFDSQKLLPGLRNISAPCSGTAGTPVTAVEPKHLGERRVVVEKQAELPALYAGYNVPTLKHADSYALEVLQGSSLQARAPACTNPSCMRTARAVRGGDYDNISADPNLFSVYAG